MPVFSRGDVDLLASEAEASWASIDPARVGKSAKIKGALAPSYLDFIRLVELTNNIAIDLGYEEAHRRVGPMLDFSAYYLFSEVCNFSDDDRRRADRALAELGSNGQEMAEILPGLRRLPGNPGQHLATLYKRFISLVVFSFQEIGIPVPGAKQLAKPKQASDYMIAGGIQEILVESDLLLLTMVRDPTYRGAEAQQAGTIIWVLTKFFYHFLNRMCPRFPADPPGPRAFAILQGSPSAPRKQGRMKNPYERRGKATYVLPNLYKYRGWEIEVKPDKSHPDFPWAVHINEPSRREKNWPPLRHQAKTEDSAAELGRLLVDQQEYKKELWASSPTGDTALPFEQMDDMIFGLARDIMYESKRQTASSWKELTRARLARAIQRAADAARLGTPPYTSPIPTDTREDLEEDRKAFNYFDSLPVKDRLRWLDSTIKRLKLIHGVIPNPGRAAAKKQPKARGHRAAFRRLMRL